MATIQSISEGLLYFILYSILGWICETVFCSVSQKQPVNRGFLKGPYCPIYGFGAMVILLVSRPVIQYPILVFLVSMLSATALEYLTSWILETVFQIRWWDYSDRRFNLNGRVSLKFSLLFGIMGWVTVCFLNPALAELLSVIPAGHRRMLSNVLATVCFLDFVITLNTLLGFTQRMKNLQAELLELQQYNKQYAWLDVKDLDGSLERLRAVCLREGASPVSAKVLSMLDSIAEKRRQGNRLLRAFPDMDARDFSDALASMRETVRQQGEAFWDRTWTAAKHFGQRSASAGKQTARAVSARLDFYNLFWVFTVASLLGYLVETAYCLVTTGVVESRQGMLYGPFNQVYGFGAVLMVLLLSHLSEKNDRWLFAGSALLGGAFEAMCSLAQEKAFGSVSWEYSEHMLSFAGGRTSLLFMFFWGVLGVFFIKGIYPRLSGLIRRIPHRQKIPLTVLLSIYFCINLLLSSAAVYRWAERTRGAPPANQSEVFLDRQYPDSYMTEVYPNMRIIDKS